MPVAETTLRELGRPTLAELLELTDLIAEREPRRTDDDNYAKPFIRVLNDPQ